MIYYIETMFSSDMQNDVCHILKMWVTQPCPGMSRHSKFIQGWMEFSCFELKF